MSNKSFRAKPGMIDIRNSITIEPISRNALRLTKMVQHRYLNVEKHVKYKMASKRTDQTEWVRYINTTEAMLCQLAEHCGQAYIH